MNALLLLLLGVSSVQSHFIIDCIAPSVEDLTKLYNETTRDNVEERTQCIPGYSVGESVNLVSSNDTGKSVPACAAGDFFQGEMSVIPGKTVYYSYVSVLDKGMESLATVSDHLIAGFNSTDMVFSDPMIPQCSDQHNSSCGWKHELLCNNDSGVCIGSVTIPEKANIGKLNMTIVWPTVVTDDQNTGPVADYKPAAKKTVYFSSCVRFNVVEPAEGKEIHARTLRSQTMESERKLWSFMVEGRSLRNQVEEGRSLRNQVEEGRSLQVAPQWEGCARTTPGKMCRNVRRLQDQGEEERNLRDRAMENSDNRNTIVERTGAVFRRLWFCYTPSCIFKLW